MKSWTSNLPPRQPAAKQAAFILLPFGGSVSARGLRELLGRHAESGWFTGLESITALAALAMFPAWGIAWWLFSVRG